MSSNTNQSQLSSQARRLVGVTALSSPPAGWQWKAQSKVVGKDGTIKPATSLFLFRSRPSADKWKQRYFTVEGGAVHYGKAQGRDSKAIPLTEIVKTGLGSVEEATNEKAPIAFRAFAWYMQTRSRYILCCSEDAQTARVWVSYILSAIGQPPLLDAKAAVLPAVSAPVPTPAGAKALLPAPSLPPPLHAAEEEESVESLVLSHAYSSREEPAKVPSAAADALSNSEVNRRETLADAEVRMASPLDGTKEKQYRGAPQLPSPSVSNHPVHVTFPLEPETAMDASQHYSIRNVADEERDDNDTSSSDDGARGVRIGKEEHASEMFSGEDDNLDGEEINEDEEDEEDDGLDEESTDSEAVDEQTQASLNLSFLSSAAAADSFSSIASQPGQSVEAAKTTPSSKGEAFARAKREAAQRRQLLAIASTVHSYLPARVPTLALHFKPGDDVNSVVFSSAVDKIGKRNNVQRRELILTQRYLYLFAKRRIGSGVQVRCVPMHDVVGVVESSSEAGSVALIIPAFHDIILRFNNVIGDVQPTADGDTSNTPTAVRQQLVAHVCCLSQAAEPDRRFTTAEVADLTALGLRWHVEDRYPALVSGEHDLMAIATHTNLCPVLRMHGDTTVQWSSMVRFVCVDRSAALAALVITDGALYVLPGTLSRVDRRTPIRDVVALLYDGDAQSVLIKCKPGRRGDLLCSVQSHKEFETLLRLIPEWVMLAGQGLGLGPTRQLRTLASKQLYSHAVLLGRQDTTGGDAEGEGRGAGKDEYARDGDARGDQSAGHRARSGKKSRRLRVSAHIRNFLRSGTQREQRLQEHLRQHTEIAAADASPHGSGGVTRPSQLQEEEVRVYSQYRFVEELVLDYDDELAVWAAVEASVTSGYQEGRWDSARVGESTGIAGVTADVPVGLVRYSAWCRALSPRDVGEVLRSGGLCAGSVGAASIACLTSEGVVLLDWKDIAAGDSSSSIGGGSRRPSCFSQTLGKANDTRRCAIASFVRWSEVRAVLRCHNRRGTYVAVMTGGTQSTDLVLALRTERHMLDFITAAAYCFGYYRNPSLENPTLLDLFSAPSPVHVARAVKRTPYDPFPTVALRHTPTSFAADALRLDVVPEVADTCRRFGDNTIYFSGVAWRFRSATVRRHLHQQQQQQQPQNSEEVLCNDFEDPCAAMCQANNHLYKSYIIVVTNCAVYHCTKGDFAVVRRTELLDITSVYVHAHDPDTILLLVPREYGMYLRVPGRGRELLAQLRAAYVEWTSYGLYLPHEHLASHKADDYFVPVTTAPRLTGITALLKPAFFAAAQATRTAAETTRQTREWHLRQLRRAVWHYERGLEAAKSGALPAAFVKGGRGRQVRKSLAADAARPFPLLSHGLFNPTTATESSSARVTWAWVKSHLTECQSALYFNQRRCYRFGLRSVEYAVMDKAQALLRDYTRNHKAASAMLFAAQQGDFTAYGQALERAKEMPVLATLTREQSAFYDVLLHKRAAVQALALVISDTGKAEAAARGLDETRGRSLVHLFRDAAASGVQPRVLRYLRNVLDTLQQRHRLRVALSSEQCCRSSSFIKAAAVELGVEVRDDNVVETLTPSQMEQREAEVLVQSLTNALVTAHQSVIKAAIQQAEVWVATRAAGVIPARVPHEESKKVSRETQHDSVLEKVSDALAWANAEYAVYKQHAETCKAIMTLGAAIQAHRGLHEHYGGEAGLLSLSPTAPLGGTNPMTTVATLEAECARLAAALPSDTETGATVLRHARTQLRVHASVLAGERQRMAQQRDAAAAAREARKRYADALHTREAAAAVDEAQRQTRQHEAETRRHKAILSIWSTRADNLCHDVHVLLQDRQKLLALLQTKRDGAAATVGEDLVMMESRLASLMKRCRLMQLTIATGMSATGATTTTTGAEAVVAARVELREDTKRIVGRLQEAEGAAREALLCNYGLRNASHQGKAVQDETTAEPLLADIPDTLVKFIDNHEAGAVAMYVSKHEDTLLPAQVQAIQALWDRSAQAARDADRVNEALAAACTLRSACLLERALVEVDKNEGVLQVDQLAVAKACKLLASLEQDRSIVSRSPSPLPIPLLSTSHEPCSPQPPPSVVSSCVTSTSSVGEAEQLVKNLYKALVRLVQDPSASLSKGEQKDEATAPAALSSLPLVCVACDNPHVADVVLAWLRIWAYRRQCTSNSSGGVAPLALLEVLRVLGQQDAATGESVASQLHRVALDFERHCETTATDVASELGLGLGVGTDASATTIAAANAVGLVLVAYVLQHGLMGHLVREIQALQQRNAAALQNAYKPGAVMALSRCLAPLRTLAERCDRVSWPFNVEDAQQLCDFLVATGTRSVPGGRDRPAAAPLSISTAPSHFSRWAGEMGVGGLGSFASPATVVSASVASPSMARVAGGTTSRDREAMMRYVAEELRGAVGAVAEHFKTQLHAEKESAAQRKLTAAGEEEGTSDSVIRRECNCLDETACPAVIPVVQHHLLPALTHLLEASLVFSPRKSVWAVISALQRHLQASPRSVAGVELLDVIALAEALVARYAGAASASQKSLDALRLRVFLRACLNRRLLGEAVRTLFPCPTRDPVWGALVSQQTMDAGDEDNRQSVWCFYDRQRSPLYPQEDPNVKQLLATLDKISALPLVLAVDRELW